MAAIEAETLNGFGSNDAPTPEAVENGLNGEGSDDGDLFGDDGDEPADNQRTLDDKDLDSGDDEGREDRVAKTVEDEDVEEERRETIVCDVDLARIRPPEGDELYLMNLPPFVGLNHRNFHYPSYQPPSKPHDASQMKASEKFSSYSTATSTMYWRRDPKNPDLMQSNARFIRWSDGSLTLQLASKPTQQYRVSTSALRQNYDASKNRLKPVPVPYDANRDTHNYIAAPHSTSGMEVQIARPLDAALRIQKSGDLADESINRLKAELARVGDIGNPLESMSKTRKDPEQLRREAEQAEKEAARAQRRIENAKERGANRRDAVLGRSGLSSRGGVGLSVGGLEDDEGMPTARGSRRTGGQKNKRRKVDRHGEIYSDDEDDEKPRPRQDEYDREDDFLADSEEEPETYEDDDELPEDEEEDEDAEGEVDDDVGLIPERSRPEPQQRRDRASTPKRAAEDDEAEGAPGRASPSQARKKRRVIDSDEDEDEE